MHGNEAYHSGLLGKGEKANPNNRTESKITVCTGGRSSHQQGRAGRYCVRAEEINSGRQELTRRERDEDA